MGTLAAVGHPRQIKPRRWSLGRSPLHYRWVFGMVSGLTLLIFIAGGLIRGAGSWLILSDPLRPSTAIVVVAGEKPCRAIEAAAIYRQGWAPEVWVMNDYDLDLEQALLRIGLHSVNVENQSVAVLKKLGVPPQSIHLLEPGRNSQEEIGIIARELVRSGGTRVILVTSPPHTRREKAIWRAEVGESAEMIVRYAALAPFDAEHWWRNNDDANAVQHELFGLLNVWAGFPSRPTRDAKLKAQTSSVDPSKTQNGSQ